MRGGEERLDSGYIFKVKLTELISYIDVRWREKK